MAGNYIAWCDGDSSSFVQLSSDLGSAQNQLWINGFYPYDGTSRILGRKIEVSIDSPYLSATTHPAQWDVEVIDFKVYGANCNVGHYNLSEGNSGQEVQFPEISIYTSYEYIDTNGKIKSRLGIGVTTLPYPGSDGLVIPKPTVIPQEPLAITLSMEASSFIRDGVHSPNIVADVTWKGQPITGKVTKHNNELNSTTYDYPFPDVTFEAGTCLRKNYEENAVDGARAWDQRGSGNGCFLIGDNADVSLGTYASTVSLSRTNIYHSLSGSHTHACEIDSSGNGVTNSTIELSGNIADHVHTFTNYVSDISLGHTHTLRSVAIVKLNPMTNSLVDIVINGYVVYDPTHCTPYALTGAGILTKPTTFPQGNRMMFDTLYVKPPLIQNRELVLEIDVTPSCYTAESVTETIRGVNVKASAHFTSYVLQDYPGHWITMPSQQVPDGTRIIFEINAFSPALSPAEEEAKANLSSTNVLIIRPDAVREYMNVQIKAMVILDGLSDNETKIVTVLSNLTWIPSVQGLLPEFTNDDIYVNEAMTHIETIGASQIHDAVKLAAQRIIDYQTENASWLTAKKIVFLLTDGDENTSENSLDQAVNNINIINGTCETPVIPIRLGYSYSSDDVLLTKYSQDTCGKNYYLISRSDATQQSVIDDIITGGAIKINDGTFSNTIDLARDNLFATASLESVGIPSGARILFRYRLSSDAKKWSAWSSWYDSSVTKNFDLNLEFKARYFQYQIHLYGNENFESPELYAGITAYYYRVQYFTIFFQPVGLDINTDEYLASIHITHKGTIPGTSLINYGCAQFDTLNMEDYSSTTRPLITPDRHTIMLTRYNELFLPYNLLSYTAINGGWSDQARFEIYRVNNSYPEGELVSSSEYAINNKTGRITFYNIQRAEDKFVLCVYFDPEFRILCNVVNYGPSPIIIDHIGVLYNVSKRIPINSQGNIIHTPINARI